MWCANLQQVFSKNPQNKDYDCWILFLKLDSDTSVETVIRGKHQEIDTTLAEQNVNYTEITTFQGRRSVYERFDCKKGRHPLFLVFNKHPLQYSKKEVFLLIEWGKWSDIDSLKNDLMAFVNFFSDRDFREKIANAKNEKLWRQALDFLKDHGLDLIKMGVSVATAIL